MARPFKQGLEYFPLDVNIFSDEKIRDLNYAVGPLGEIIYIRILTLIYANGYYINTSLDKLAKILHKDLGQQWIKLERISKLIHACLEAGLFDKELSGQGVITSIAVQKQFLISTQRRKNVDKTKYWLLDDSAMRKVDDFLTTSKLGASSSKTVVDVDNNQVNVDISTQKEKNILIKNDKRVYGKPKLHFLTTCLIKNKYIEEFDLNIFKYNDLAEKLVYDFGFEIMLSVTDYIMKCSKKENIIISDKFEYYKSSAYNNANMLLAKSRKGTYDFEKQLEELLKEVDR